jgi:hypothetical protein
MLDAHADLDEIGIVQWLVAARQPRVGTRSERVLCVVCACALHDSITQPTMHASRKPVIASTRSNNNSRPNANT